MRLTKDDVIMAASELADRDGLNQVTLKAVAEKLGIRTPSLYNHIDSLDGLLRAVAHRGMRDMNNLMTRSAVGIAGEGAVQAISRAYFDYLIAHPGVYETIQWALWHGNADTEALFAEYRSLLGSVIQSCGLKSQDTGAILDLLTGFLHGYATLQLGRALKDREAAVKGLSDGVDTLLRGIRSKYG